MRGVGSAKRWVVQRTAAAVAAGARRRAPRTYRPGVTIVTVNWNALPFLSGMLDATRAMSPPSAEVLVVDNGSSDGSMAHLRSRRDIRVLRLPVNVGHGPALDIAVPRIDTEYVAVLDVDAFPISDRWLEESVAALERGARIAGARLHRNFVHPCFLVTRTELLHRYALTFRPVGSLATLPSKAPLFLDVGEALSQRAIVKFGGGSALHFFEISSVRGPGNTGAVFADLVYHNLYSTHGGNEGSALEVFREALERYHPTLHDAVDHRG